MKCWLWAGVLLSLVSCAASQKPKASTRAAREYYPLAVGNSWTYDAKMLGEQRAQTVEITGQKDGFYVDSQGGQLAVDAFGVRDQKRYLLRDPLERGAHWTNVVSVSSTERYQVADAGFSCDSPAGRFDDCVRVEGRNRVDPNITLVNEVTFAPGVGIVRIEVFAESTGRRIPQTVLALKSYSVAPQNELRR